MKIQHLAFTTATTASLLFAAAINSPTHAAVGGGSAALQIPVSVISIVLALLATMMKGHKALESRILNLL